jgi:DtxR family Mn-dependent transcriptional regulator
MVIKVAGLSQSNEDYLEAILVIGLKKERVRVRDLAQQLEVKDPSVVTAIKKLAGEGLVRHESYRHVELTPQGFKLAQEIHNRHKLLFRFLHSFLGLDEDTAENDACAMEHWLSTQTIARIIHLLEFTEACPSDEEPRWLLAFRHFTATGNFPQSCQYLAEDIPLLPDLAESEKETPKNAKHKAEEESTALTSLTMD